MGHSIRDRWFLGPGLGRGGIAPSPLLTGLAGYWKLDEAEGNARADSLGISDLAESSTDTTGVPSGAGKVNDAAYFNSANAESLSHAASAQLNAGDIDFTLAGWFYLADKTAGHALCSKEDSGVGDKEFIIVYNTGADRMQFLVYDGGVQVLSADVFGSPPQNVWFYVLAWHNSAANTMNIRVNNGMANSAAINNLTPTAQTGPFCLGRRNVGGLSLHQGRIDEFGYWKRVLSTDEQTALYNGGAGVTYPFTGILAYAPLEYQKYALNPVFA